MRAADEDVAQSVANLRPIIEWTADVTRDFSQAGSSLLTRNSGETTANLGIVGSLMLYDFGRRDFLTEAAKETVLATREVLRSVEQDVLLTAVQAYMNVIRNREFVLLRRNNLRLLEEELRAASDRFEVGEVTRTDVAQAEAAVALAQSGLAAAEGDFERAVEEFREAIGRAPGDLRTPGDLPRLRSDVAAAKAAAVRRHPDVLEAQRNVTVSELNMQAAAAAKRPTLNLTGRLGTTNDRLAQLHLAGLQVKQDVGNAFANLGAAQARREANREAVRAARVAFEGTREEVKLGARTTLDVLDAEQDLLDAEASLISANADVVIAAYAVLASMGDLTVRDLNLGVRTYDPAAYYDLVKTAPVPLSPQGKKLDRVLRALGKN